MIKTISLTANQETAVKIEGGSYCLIENRGTSVVYASKFPNVVASEDNVIAIDSASAKILENATIKTASGIMQGTIYLVTDSDGAVEVRTATTTDSFKSKQKGGGESSGGGVTDTYPQSVIDAKLAKKADEEVVNQALNNKVDKDGNKVLSDNNFSNDEKEKLANLVNYDDTQVKTDIINLQTSKANVDEVYTIAQTNSAIASEVAKIVADAPARFDTLKEISAWIDTNEDSVASMNLAIQENATNISQKVDKKDGYSLVSDTEITRLAEVKNYDDTQIKNDIALNTSSVGMSKKNLFNVPVTVTKGGITFTADEDGYITPSTVTDTRTWTYANAQYSIYLPAGTYYVSAHMRTVCTHQDGAGRILTANNDILAYIDVKTDSSERIFTVQEDAKIYIIIKLFDGVGAFMIRSAAITDSTYEPYTPSLQEQINNIVARLTAGGL